MAPELEDTQESFGALFDSDSWSDFTITCGEIEWDCHRAIICTRSNYFQKACQNHFKEGKSQYIELKDEEPDMILKMLLFLYSSDYPESTESQPRKNAVQEPGPSKGKGKGRAAKKSKKAPSHIDFPSASTKKTNAGPPKMDVGEGLLTHAKMYSIGDRFDIPLLRAHAKTKFVALLSQLAESWDGWKQGTLSNIIETVYTTTPSSDRGLRDHVSFFIRHQWPRIRKSDGEVAAYLLGNGEVAVDVIDWTSTNYDDWQRKYLMKTHREGYWGFL